MTAEITPEELKSNIKEENFKDLVVCVTFIKQYCTGVNNCDDCALLSPQELAKPLDPRVFMCPFEINVGPPEHWPNVGDDEVFSGFMMEYEQALDEQCFEDENESEAKKYFEDNGYAL